jgi:hypothetical protein
MKEDPSLVGYWSFNEGKGTIIYDQSGKNNNGTLYLGSSGNTDPSKAWSPGISGTALSFDGSDDYVSISHSTSLSLTQGFTITFWFKMTENRFQPYLQKGASAYEANYLMATNPGAGEFLTFGWYNGGWRNNKITTSEHPIELNKWFFGAGVWDGTYSYIYLNGELWHKVDYSAYPPLANTASLLLGRQPGTSYYVKGLIDEVRIYNRALSEQEILEHYRNSKYYLASHFGPKTNCREDPGSCIDYGLVGYWSFDEGAGTTAYDASGKGNNGTIYGAKWSQGKNNQALSFDGVDDKVNCGSSESLNLTQAMTVLAWVYPIKYTGYPATILSRHTAWPYSGYALDFRNNKIEWLLLNNGTSYALQTSWNAPLNQWYFIAGTFDGITMKLYVNGKLEGQGRGSVGSTSGYELHIGECGYHGASENIKAIIDEVRIYNRALSEEEIRYLYNRGAPIAHWKFDEGKGNIAYDSSGNGNNGTIYGAQWVPGKFGSALSFDGVDDYVDCGNNPSVNLPDSFTIEAWIKPLGSTGNYNPTVDKQSNYRITLYSDRHIKAEVWVPGVTNPYISTPANFFDWGKWYHFAFVRDKANSKIIFYWNGAFYNDANDTTVGYNITNTYTLKIGRFADYGEYFMGLIDDVRIYNYARTPEQILQDYNAGLSAHFK